jgi:glycosyltransferase involved in cell wall biosynthesis
MRILYVHQNFPAQFGHIASHLAGQLDWDCSFVSETAPGLISGVKKIQYKLLGGATQQNHFCSRTFENTIWHCDAVYQAMKKLPDYQPDLIVGHSGFGSTLFLRELYPKVPCINLFEYYYRPHGTDSDMDFRHDLGWPMEDQKFLRARARNAMILLDLQNCDAAYSPTQFQRSRFPAEYQPKIDAIFDGVDRQIYHGFDESLRLPLANRTDRVLAGVSVSPTTRVVTYVSRGFESMRGFDVFIKIANRVCLEFPDVVFLVVGTDRMSYGGDSGYIGDAKTFKDWVLARTPIDTDRVKFVGQVAPTELAKLLASTDLHLYLTVPFVLSWSMVNAMSCGAVVLGSDTAPVAEMITDGENGLLANFFDVEAFAAKAISVLKDPNEFRPLGRAAEQKVEQNLSMTVTMPRMLELYQRTIERGVTGRK